MIPQSFIEEIRSRVDIAELISSYIPLKKAGRNFKAVCPFHGEKTPSFIVSPQKQIFHCFGCGVGGGVFQFLTLIEKINFPEAVEVLADKLGLAIPHEKGKTQAKAVLYEAMSEAVSFFHNNLKNNRSCQSVRGYLSKRGIGEKTINKFCLGYAGSNNSLLNHMRKRGFTLEVLEKTSLIVSGRNGFRDVFNDRIIFPIFDVRSRVVGFGARLWKELPGSPKYINSLESALYRKRDHLFGFNFSKEEIMKESSVVVAEGYLDMIIPYMRGLSNIVASLGTALTIEQIHLIKRYASSVILMYDSDKAGVNAALRSLDLLIEEDLGVEVVNLPTGYDPDSLIREKGKDYFSQLLGKRRNFFEYKIDTLRKIYDIDSIEGKTKIAQEMFATIDKISSEIKKYEYIRKLAASLKIEEEIMIAEFRNNFLKGSKKQHLSVARKNSSVFTSTDPLPITEKILFKFMLTNSKAFFLIRKKLKEDCFSSYLAQKTISVLFNVCPQGEHYSAPKLLEAIKDKEVSSFVSKILMDDGIPLDKELFKESLLKLRKKGIKQVKQKLKDKIRQAEKEGNSQEIKELIDEYNRIARA